MLPSTFQRSPSRTNPSRGPAPLGLSWPLFAAACVSIVGLLVFAGVAATMGVAPTPVAQVVELPVQ